eukprot:4527526-Amphidinium_carterae.1
MFHLRLARLQHQRAQASINHMDWVGIRGMLAFNQFMSERSNHEFSCAHRTEREPTDRVGWLTRCCLLVARDCALLLVSSSIQYSA